MTDLHDATLRHVEPHDCPREGAWSACDFNRYVALPVSPKKPEPGLREAAQTMADAYRDIEGDIINGRTDAAYRGLLAALRADQPPSKGNE